MSTYDYDPEDPDAPQPEDLDDDAGEGDDDGEDAVTCPNCRRELHEDAAVCPHCGEWIIDESLAARRSRGWFWPVMVGLLIALVLVLWTGLR